MSTTPTLDKFGLHPIGGYCTCYSKPYATCRICEAVKAHQKRWEDFISRESKESKRRI